MKDRFPTLFARAGIAPRVHRVFGGIGFVLAVGLLLVLVAVGEGDLGQRFWRALGKGILLVGVSGAYLCWALTLRATRDPVWAALVAGRIKRVYPYVYKGATGNLNSPCVGVETTDGQTLSMECQKVEEQQAILAEFTAAGNVEVAAAR